MLALLRGAGPVVKPVLLMEHKETGQFFCLFCGARFKKKILSVAFSQISALDLEIFLNFLHSSMNVVYFFSDLLTDE